MISPCSSAFWVGGARNDTIKSVKRQLMEQETMFAYHLFDKGLISRVYKELQKKITQLKNEQKAWPVWLSG